MHTQAGVAPKAQNKPMTLRAWKPSNLPWSIERNEVMSSGVWFTILDAQRNEILHTERVALADEETALNECLLICSLVNGSQNVQLNGQTRFVEWY